MKYKTRIEKLKVYDVYKNNQFICNGTMQEIADFLEIKRKVAVKYKREGFYLFIERYIVHESYKDEIINHYEEKELRRNIRKNANKKQKPIKITKREGKKLYAIYDDDTFLTIGTLQEIADWLDITYESLLSYKSRSNRYIFVEV